MQVELAQASFDPALRLEPTAKDREDAMRWHERIE